MRSLLSVLCLALCAALLPAAASAQATVTAREHTSTIAYTGTVTLGLDSVAVTKTTPAFQIADANQGVAFIRLKTNDVTGTETVDIALDVSSDLVTWDQVGTVKASQGATSAIDTLSTVAGNTTRWKSARYARLRVVGASGNRRGVVLTYWALLPKNSGAANSGTARVVE